MENTEKQIDLLCKTLKTIQFLLVVFLIGILGLVTKNQYIILVSILIIALLSFVKMNYID